jgi:hypothetical protein
METLVLKPSLWQDIRLPHQFLDFNAMLMINNNFEIGGMYRTDKAVAAMASVILSKKTSNRFCL